jgi:hypothetical protein
LGYIDPDVCLVTDGTDLFAVAVYLANWVDPTSFNYESEYILECFRYNYSTNAFAKCTSFVINNFKTGAGGPATSNDFEINIDGFDNKFVIAWNDESGAYVRAATGLVDQCANLTCSSDTVYYYNRATNPGNLKVGLPDVAMNDRDSVYFVYLTEDISTSISKIEVAHIRYGGSHGLCGSGLSHITIACTTGVSTVGEYINPRIACPNLTTTSTGATTSDFMVVAEETDKSTQWKILGINYYSVGMGLTFLNYYNDGSGFSLADLDDTHNVYPVVTYSKDGNIIIGWMFNNSSGVYSPAATAYYPIAVECYADGKISSTNYMDVPYLVATSDFYSSLSVAGRYYADNLYTFCRMEDDLYTKTVVDGSSSLRIAAANSLVNYDIQSLLNNNYLIPNLSDYLFTLQLTDISGKQIAIITGNIDDMQSKYKRFINSISPGIYFGKLYSTDRSITSSGKLIVQH